MKNRCLAAFAFFFVFISPILAAAPPAAAAPAVPLPPIPSPRFFINGTDWKNITNLTADGDFVKALKLYTLEGVFDGLTALLAQGGPGDFPKNTQAISSLIPPLTNGQIMDALDKFYLDSKNEGVPLLLALPIIARQASGAKPADLAKMMDGAQKIAAELDAAKTLDDFAKISREIIANNQIGAVAAK